MIGSAGDTLFLVVLATYLLVATVLIYRNPMHGWGFPLFVLLYPVFLVGFFVANAPTVMFAWLGLSVINMIFQYISLQRQPNSGNTGGVLVASLFLWPIQFAALINSSQSDKEIVENKKLARQKIGQLPATLQGTVVHCHHIGSEEGHDMVWLEEYEDQDFMTDSATYDQIGIAEGRQVELTVEEREAPEGMSEDKVLWISGGRVIEQKPER